MDDSNPTYANLRYNVVPPVFLVVFTVLAQILVKVGNPDSDVSVLNLGSVFAWKLVLAFYAWAYVSLKIPSKKYSGPATPDGYVPVYSANGTQYYLVSLVAFLALITFNPSLCADIYDDFASVMSCLNLTALALCAYLTANSALPAGDEKLPKLYLFYRGVELHPRLLGVDVKQWTNCRVGMLGWALLVIVFAVAGASKNPTLDVGAVVNAALINLYLFKFFYWETGYFTTLDITLDRAGYYLCWGCLVWVQVRVFC